MILTRALRIVASVLIVLLALLAATSIYLIRRPFPQISGSVRVQGLQAEVQVIRDRWGIPHIFAQNERDLFFAQGYVHAQDRLWQMELSRRVASGRLSEIFGEVTLDTDRFFRTLGLRRVAEEEVRLLNPQQREILEAYSAGVNAYITTHRRRLPLEFTILRLTPEPWTPADSLVFGKLMSWVLGGNWKAELLRAALIARFGEEGAKKLLPPYPEDAPIIVPEEARAYYQAVHPDALWAVPGSLPSTGIGSNNWVVAGSRTATGAPLLANDPHLEGQMPSIWYEAHLVGGRFDVIGATFAGVPGVIIGHNRHIAWGVTNVGPDVQDLYLERLHPNDPTRYLFRGNWEPLRIVREEIRVKGRAEPFLEEVRLTRHGPILNNVIEGLPGYVALRWTALQPNRLYEAVIGINLARNWQEFREALRKWAVPSQNFIYADIQGNIGYQMPGLVPIRAKGNGLVPVPGWTGEYEWVGFIPFEELPSRFNPKRGYIITANNRVPPPRYRYFISAEWDPGFRAKRIEQLLTEKEKLDIPDFQRIQRDVLSLVARIVLPRLEKLNPQDPKAQKALELLKGWDGLLSPESTAGAVYEAFMVKLPEVLFKDVLGKEVYDVYRKAYWLQVPATLDLLGDPPSGWWQGDQGKVLEKALAAAYEELEERLGKDPKQWRWGTLHQPRFTHALGRLPVLAWIFNATPPPTGGDGFTVNNGGYDPDRPFRQTIVASYRQILDLADWDRSLAMHTTGQSGLPFHRHYRDFVSLWAKGEYHPLLFSRARIEASAEGRLVLRP
ncbi:MAG: penicillin acylase family protein [Armatimonadota bacterium]|nr:penicillin acylase family protein [Armatimonadota bacterium]